MDLTLRETDDRAIIEAFLRCDPLLHLYEIGDLDPFFWPKTRWFGAWLGDDLRALALRYAAPGVDAVLLLERREPEAATWLARKLHEVQCGPFHAHFSPGLGELFADRNARSVGLHRKMTLAQDASLPPPRSGVRRLTAADIPALRELYDRAYPGNWFDAAMVETEQYFGGFDGGGHLCAVAGVHVFAPAQKVAALGNITTSPEARGQGWARAVTAEVCRSLSSVGIEHIGLNVKATNAPAIACYEKLGFVHEADYVEWDVDGAEARG